MSPRPKPVVLAVIDGWGVAPTWGGNAIALAQTPFYNEVKKVFPNTTLAASGDAVGLPAKFHGNSEVGHLNIGTGQVVQQSLPAITTAISDNSFFSNPALVNAFQRINNTDNSVHIMGLASDGGIHSHIDHLFALLDMAKHCGVKDVCIHVITDGRDTSPFVSQQFCALIDQKIAEVGIGRICTVSGRYYAMDRDNRWDRIEKTYRAITEGVGLEARTPEAAIASAYRDGFSDEFIVPTVIRGEGNSFRPLSDGDSLIFFNFRGDRAREITQAFVRPNFKEFERKVTISSLYFVGFTFYQEGLPIQVAFHPRDVKYPLARILSDAGLKQLHVAESEKYAHVTYFFNGGREESYPREDRIVVPSPKVSSYDQTPAMSTTEITETVISHITNYDFILLNYACPDMIGHTGNLRAAIQAVEAVDKSMAEIFKTIQEHDGVFIITADHGNVEQMVNPKTGEPDTEHTGHPVPFIVANDTQVTALRSGGKLSDVAPTILQIMGIAAPDEMEGKSLITSPTPTSPVTTAPV
ncbi:phosphoglycerate mutase (2,3-diphosphoglycerate-independent) [Candidatus Berkelbacteria bacterium RIFCSPLOWO2_01_FULL_50_28]|uniref:2,3-bisphosphoglycerate-independent phosphoglycerate mutase n=1 Tax=Candidatus Berkelbacteria bacterium RIFCSPLOWO2_01_FULL_50_28 TaxID=1797471 RepID=A0A1F5ECD1_9BACT|nr:MAG: phosphoglycerate mutase (2,3-diphosphoglycerate-independent) [Candidatus Berkelbacteria bacterium RIFCSPHIGHO2_01_FULL_50_36]OGD62232.1 MAG: phosphoglycerate mutase (2,3-diphosphoglycerate-independent) [Candidatus Berkelbacteria bacterium RIFCSPHIGHO2_12_FULL_50_11]OGD64874.1 MAG: phosphoglycerate mutase (2,3-diphosphoglycerate-independent) [Candidatus Berkelbacteria bacterium RIFCSPLOWO2_01_FULL_50_28]